MAVKSQGEAFHGTYQGPNHTLEETHSHPSLLVCTRCASAEASLALLADKARSPIDGQPQQPSNCGESVAV